MFVVPEWQLREEFGSGSDTKNPLSAVSRLL